LEKVNLKLSSNGYYAKDSEDVENGFSTITSNFTILPQVIILHGNAKQVVKFIKLIKNSKNIWSFPDKVILFCLSTTETLSLMKLGNYSNNIYVSEVISFPDDTTSFSKKFKSSFTKYFPTLKSYYSHSSYEGYTLGTLISQTFQKYFISNTIDITPQTFIGNFFFEIFNKKNNNLKNNNLKKIIYNKDQINSKKFFPQDEINIVQY